MNRADKIRVTVDLSEALNERIESIAEETGRTKADVLRLSLDLLLRATDAAKANMTVGAWKEDQDKRIEREFVGINPRR